jgi:colicin import membrane protein
MVADADDPVPLGYRFDVVWRGYHRRQVDEYVEVALRYLTADRDAAINLVCNLTRLLEQSRSQARHLRERYDRLCRTPLAPDALGERVRRVVQLAQAEASEIVTRARARAEHIRLGAAEDAARQLARAEQRRQQIEADFQTAMSARRAESLRRLRVYEAARRAEADRVVREAREEAARRLASAAAQVETLHDVQRRLAQRLRAVRGLFLRTCSLVDPPDGDETDLAAATVPVPDGHQRSSVPVA